MKIVEIYTDGACTGNPGKGGWGAVLIYNGTKKEISAGYVLTTNNRMELLAAISALEILRESCEVMLYSDSKYLCDSINKGWIYGWIKNGWKKSDKKPVLNVDLWQRLIALMKTHSVKFNWVKGHAGHPMNERCDALAVEAYTKNAVLHDSEYERIGQA